jgi:hypothetical protein
MARKLKTPMPNIIAPDWKDIQGQAERFVVRYQNEAREESPSSEIWLNYNIFS